MSDSILVTGAFGLVGAATVHKLACSGHTVIATDLDTAPNRGALQRLPANVDVRWADLTDATAINRLLAEVEPAAVIHLAAVIPPAVYANPTLARRVNVDATGELVAAAQRLPRHPRFLLASSNAVFGSRNPHTSDALLTADSPAHPSEIYGAHKLAAERLVRSSTLPWVVLRLAGVLSVQSRANYDLDSLRFGTALPNDGRVHAVDVRDVASAFTAAITADVVGETLLIGGDRALQLRHGDIARDLATAAGLIDALPPGLPGNPRSDDDWFATDWMDTTDAQRLLNFQRHSWPDMLDEARAAAGWRRYPARIASPIVRIALRRMMYTASASRYADPWGAIRARWGEPLPTSAPT